MNTRPTPEISEREIKSNLCYYDPRNQNDSLGADEDEDYPQPRKKCSCDNCFYGRDKLAIQLLQARVQRDRLADLVKQFISILDITEESDSGRLFHPTNITSCRAGDLQKIGELVEELRRASLHQPTEL